MTDDGSVNVVEAEGVEILDVEPAPEGAGECEYGCDDDPEHRVTVGRGGGTATMDACLSCMNRAGLYPQDHEQFNGGDA